MASTVFTRITSWLFVSLALTQNSNSQLISFGNNNLQPAATSPNLANCNYLLSTNNAGSCVVTTVDVEKKLTTITDDISRARLQYVAQNSVLQSQIAKIEDSGVKTALRVDGLQRDLLALRSRISSIASSGSSSSSSTSNANLSQLQSSLLQNIQAVDNRVSSLTSAYQRDAVSQAQTNAALQRQLTQLLSTNNQLSNANVKLTQDYNTLKQDMQALSAQLQALSAKCQSCGTATSAPVTVPAVVPTINPARLQQIENQLKTLDGTVQQQSQDITRLDNLVVNNHSNELVNIHLELQSFDARLGPAINKTDLVYQSLQNFNTITIPALQRDVRNLQRDTGNLQTSVQGLQTTQRTLLNDTVFLKLDMSKLDQDFKTGQTLQNQAIQQLTNGMANALGNTYPMLNAVKANVNNLLSGKPVVIPPPLTSSTTAASSSGGGFVVPPTLKPRPGPGK